MRAVRLSFVGELGWELHVPSRSAVRVYESIMQAGHVHGIVNAGYRAMESLSNEKGDKFDFHTEIKCYYLAKDTTAA